MPRAVELCDAGQNKLLHAVLVTTVPEYQSKQGPSVQSADSDMHKVIGQQSSRTKSQPFRSSAH